jgi:D-serine deaminase-like pyridoxal phosphate-dependent protein
MELDRKTRSEQGDAAMTDLLAVADAVRHTGLEVEIVSAGGTGTYDLTGARVGSSEIQAGSYVSMDAQRLGITPAFAVALTVLATVVSKQGTTLVLDSGRKAIGMLREAPFIRGLDASLRSFAEEHMVLDLAGPCPLDRGDQVRVVSGYAPLTANLHEVYHVIEDDMVVDLWPVVARGASRMG